MRSMHPGFFGNRQGEKWKLEALSFDRCWELEEEWPRMESAMPLLRLLKVDWCPKLKLFPCNVENGRGIWRKEDDDQRNKRRKDESNSSVIRFLHRIISCVDCD